MCSLHLQWLHAPMGTSPAPVLKALGQAGWGEVGGALQTPPTIPYVCQLRLDCCLPKDESQGLVNSGVFAVLGWDIGFHQFSNRETEGWGRLVVSLLTWEEDELRTNDKRDTAGWMWTLFSGLGLVEGLFWGVFFIFFFLKQSKNTKHHVVGGRHMLWESCVYTSEIISVAFYKHSHY